MTKFQDKERILKEARENQEIIYKGAPKQLEADFSKSHKGLARNIPTNEKQRHVTKPTLSSKALN